MYEIRKEKSFHLTLIILRHTYTKVHERITSGFANFEQQKT